MQRQLSDGVDRNRARQPQATALGGYRARQAWFTKFFTTTDEIDDFINRNVMLNMVNTAS